LYKTYAKAFLDHISSEHKGRNIGAFLLEPLMLGAGCLKFIDPLYQKVFIVECRSRGIPIVYDEVSISFHIS
jgi:bifunctional dethiobiotin synthetase / adenosylmethionine---8-amino-7-oxononanoate aminotransferase